jgi:hypothetical protein
MLIEKPSKINIKTYCVFRRDTRSLVFEGFDTRKDLPFYRPLGGSVKPGETWETPPKSWANKLAFILLPW